MVLNFQTKGKIGKSDLNLTQANLGVLKGDVMNGLVRNDEDAIING